MEAMAVEEKERRLLQQLLLMVLLQLSPLGDNDEWSHMEAEEGEKEGGLKW